jgi:hypothetical protein
MLMYRKSAKYGLLALLFVGILVPAGADVSFTATKDVSPPLAVSIAVPEQDGQRRLTLSNKSPHFFVVLRNVSNHPISIYGEHSMWGAYNLTLEVTAVGGKSLDKPLVVTREWGADNWFANVAYAETLMPGDEVVRDVRVQGKPAPSVIMGDGTYRPFPLPASTDHQAVQMQAVFAEKEDPTAQTHVWSGQATSEVRNYDVAISVP